MRETRLINRFFEKILIWEMGYLGPKIAHPHNSRSAGRIFLKFCTMKGDDDRSGGEGNSVRMGQRDMGKNCYMTG